METTVKYNEADLYIMKVKNLYNKTAFYLMRFPQEWKTLYADPISNSCLNLMNKLVEANAVYIGAHDSSVTLVQQKQAYEKRIKLLVEALHLMKIYTAAIDLIMLQIDFSRSIRNTLYHAFNDIAKEMKEDGEPVRFYIDAKYNFVYNNQYGQQEIKVPFTSKNAEHWTNLRLDLTESIKKRIKADKMAVRNLDKKISSE